MNALISLEEIEADIAEAERLMTALRLKTAVKRSARQDTTAEGRRLLKIVQGWMLLQDQRQRALDTDSRLVMAARTSGSSSAAMRHGSAAR
jgi:hypothetical protein